MQEKIKSIIKTFKRKSFEIKVLEKKLLNIYDDESAYISDGGYKTFAQTIILLENEGLISEIKSSPYYYKIPYIKSKYKRLETGISTHWDTYIYMIYSDLLDLTYFKDHKNTQSDLNLKYIKRIYDFIQNRENRFWASQEERALEIFDDEKYFMRSDNLLKKLKLNPNLSFKNFSEALKMQKNTQMFVFFEEKSINNNRVLILENQSTFFTAKRLIFEKVSFFQREYQYIIWGQGKGIIKQLEMLSRITDPKEVTIDYFGDIDPEGYFIFLKLKEKYSDLKINLLNKAYEALLEENQFYHYHQKQNKNEGVLENILEFFEKAEHQQLIKRLWEENLRIPQEIITYEYMKRCDQ